MKFILISTLLFVFAVFENGVAPPISGHPGPPQIPPNTTYNCQNKDPCVPSNYLYGPHLYFPHDVETMFVQCTHPSAPACFEMKCPTPLVWNYRNETCDYRK